MGESASMFSTAKSIDFSSIYSPEAEGAIMINTDFLFSVEVSL
jgi:hypothetical protein